VGVEISHADGQTDRHDEADSRFWQILRMCLNKKKSKIRESDIFSEERVRSIIISTMAYGSTKPMKFFGAKI